VKKAENVSIKRSLATINIRGFKYLAIKNLTYLYNFVATSAIMTNTHLYSTRIAFSPSIDTSILINDLKLIQQLMF